jgi:serine/threonine protein phosphatase 1
MTIPNPVYAIGDIHGHADKLRAALERIEADGGPDAPVVVLGDLVDRGPDSRGVIDLLIEGRAAGRDWTVLLGNHDRMFLEFVREGQTLNPQVRSGKSWLDPVMGGRETLLSYGIDPDAPDAARQAARAVPDDHVAFLSGLPLYLQRGPHLFVHAGIRPGLALHKQVETDLLWIRDDFLNHEAAFDWLVIHGHTARKQPEHRGNRVNLDAGAGWGRPLTAASIEGDAVFVLEPEGRRPLPPAPD